MNNYGDLAATARYMKQGGSALDVVERGGTPEGPQLRTTSKERPDPASMLAACTDAGDGWKFPATIT